MLLDLRPHAAAGVAHRQLDVAPGRHALAPVARAVLVELQVSRREGERPPLRHGVSGVEGQVEQGVLELCGVGLDDGVLGGSLHANLDPPVETVSQEAEDLVERLMEIERVLVNGTATGERQKLLGEVGGSLGGPDDVARPLPALFVRQILHEEQGVAQNPGQQIVEIVGDATGETADGLHALRVVELALEELALLARGFHLLDVPSARQILGGRLGQEVGDDEQRLTDRLEALQRHLGHLGQGRAKTLPVGTDLVGVVEHRLQVLRLVPDLADEPIGDVSPADGDARPAVPEPHAQAGLDDRPFGVVAADDSVGPHAVGLPPLGPSNDVFAEPAEVARPRERPAVGQHDHRGDAHRVREDVLNGLNLLEVEEILELQPPDVDIVHRHRHRLTRVARTTAYVLAKRLSMDTWTQSRRTSRTPSRMMASARFETQKYSS